MSWGQVVAIALVPLLFGVWVGVAVVRMLPHYQAAWQAHRDYELWSTTTPGGFVTEWQRKQYATTALAQREASVRAFWLETVWPLVALFYGIRALVRMATLTRKEP